MQTIIIGVILITARENYQIFLFHLILRKNLSKYTKKNLIWKQDLLTKSEIRILIAGLNGVLNHNCGAAVYCPFVTSGLVSTIRWKEKNELIRHSHKSKRLWYHMRNLVLRLKKIFFSKMEVLLRREDTVIKA